MCGIAGELSFRREPVAEDWVRRACALMQHRGPDGEGVHRSGRLALGHRRLSVIDVAGGAQPMAYAGGRYWITYNGEVYNYRELRAELEARGGAFGTDSDTEVVVAAYAAWGVEFLTRLDGIFSFGLWDGDARTLLLARDPLGVKPLLYHCDAGGMRFASELKALLAHPAVSAETDAEGVEEYLALGYTLAPRTVVRGIRKLPAGHHLLVSDRPMEPVRYWDFADAACAPTEGTERAHIDRFDEILDRTVRMQMVSDVPLGAFLSGGIDSSTVSYYAARHDAGLETFSIAFDEPSFDESPYAARVAEHLETAHRVRTSRAPTPEALEKLVWFYDEPLGDTSIIPTYDLSRFARERLTVALSGDGADELFAGYDTHLADRLHALYAHVPRWLHRGAILPAARRIPSSYRKVSLDFKIKRFVENASQTAERAHFGWRSMFDDDERLALTGSASSHDPFEAYARHYQPVRAASPLNRSLYVDVKTWLVDDILAKVDRASMACGLEVRVPFLAPRLVREAMQLPDSLKLRRFQRKVILKRLMRDRLPRGVLHRKKRGFNAPVSSWMRGPLRGWLDEILRQGSSSLVDLRSPVVSGIWREHISGASDHGYKLWTLFSLVLWERGVLR